MKPSTKWIIAAAVAVIAVAAFVYHSKDAPATSNLSGAATESATAPASEQRAATDPPSPADEKGAKALASGDPLQAMTFEEIKAAAARGSVIAQRQLADIYAMCGPYSVNPATWLATLDGLAEASPQAKQGMEQVKKRLVARCDQVDGGQVIPKEARNLWAQQAAKNGDVTSTVKLRVESPDPLSGKEAAELADAVVASGDPQAMLEMSSLMSRPIEDELPDRYAQVAGNPTAGVAWGIAACRAGAACGNGSMLMDSVCMSTGRCNYPSYEAFLMGEMVPPGERARLSAMLSNIAAIRRP